MLLRDRLEFEGRNYLVRFFVCVCGSGGVFSIARSKLSVRRFASFCGRKSSDLISEICCAALGFGLVMIGSLHYGQK
jgi:hypothetical protein